MRSLLTAMMVAGDLGQALGTGRVQVHGIPRSETREWLSKHHDLIDSLGLRESAWRTFWTPYLIAEVRQLTAPASSPPEFCITVEVSYTAHPEGARKATDHARIVEAVKGLPAYPAVASVLVAEDNPADPWEHVLYEDAALYLASPEPNALYLHRLLPEDEIV